MEDYPDKPHAASDLSKEDNLRPKVIFLTTIISTVATLGITQIFDVIKSKHAEDRLKPENNVHIIALDAKATKSECKLDIGGLQTLAADKASMKQLPPIDKFSVDLFVKKRPLDIKSNQISATLLTTLKNKQIVSCINDTKPLDTLHVAFLVSQTNPYVLSRRCDVLSRLEDVSQATDVKIGQVEIMPQKDGNTSALETKLQPANDQNYADYGPYNVIKETRVEWASFIPSDDKSIIDRIKTLLNSGDFHIGLRCEFLNEKGLTSKDIDYHKVRVTKL